MVDKVSPAQEAAERWAKAILERPLSEAATRGLVGPDTEAERMRRVPGIEFMDSSIGRRAVVAGSRIGVWEVIEDYLLYGRNRADLQLVYDWLEPVQLDAALAYYAAYREEIDELMALGEAFARILDRHRD